MDDARNTRNNVIFVVVVLILVGVALMYVFTGSSTTEIAATTSEYEIVLASVKQIQDLTIAGGILDDPGFASLQDFSVPVNPITPPGRANPFLSF